MTETRCFDLPLAPLLATICLAGCGGLYDAKVTGTVSLDGQSLSRGTVAFNPASGGPAGYSMIDRHGKYAVMTGREQGLPSGDYTVTVVANESPATQGNRQGGPPPPGKPITPAWYRTKQTSGLRHKVNPGQNQINLELFTEPPPGWKPLKTKRPPR